MIYSIDELRQKVEPIAIKYELPAVYVFGSYARNEAGENSDIDFLIDKTGSKIRSLFDMGDLYNDLYESVEKEIDIVTTDTLEQKSTQERTPQFVERVRKDMVKVYGKQ